MGTGEASADQGGQEGFLKAMASKLNLKAQEELVRGRVMGRGGGSVGKDIAAEDTA